MPEAVSSIYPPAAASEFDAPPRGHLPFKTARIYVLRDPRTNEVRYVGVTTQAPERRLGSHIFDARSRPNSPVRKWVRSLLVLGMMPIMEIVETVPPGPAWCAAERRWIAHYRQLGVKLKNLTDGGDGTYGLSFTAAHRAAISKGNTGGKRTPEQRAKMSVAAKKRGVHPITRAKQRLSMLRETRSPDVAERRRLARAGKSTGPRSEEAKAKLRAARLANPTGNAGKSGAENAWSRAVVVDGVRYATATEAGKSLGLTQSAISQRVKACTAMFATDTDCPMQNAEAKRMNAQLAASKAARKNLQLRPVMIGHIRFPSLKAAAEYCGICPASMIERIQRGRASYATD